MTLHPRQILPPVRCPQDPSESWKIVAAGATARRSSISSRSDAISPAQVIGVLSVDHGIAGSKASGFRRSVIWQMPRGWPASRKRLLIWFTANTSSAKSWASCRPLDDFVKRFPQYALQLQRQAKVHDAIESGNAPESDRRAPHPSILSGATAEQLAKNFPGDRLPTITGYTILSPSGARGNGPGLQSPCKRVSTDGGLKVIKQECLFARA